VLHSAAAFSASVCICRTEAGGNFFDNLLIFDSKVAGFVRELRLCE
jgi:hypothetical protein